MINDIIINKEGEGDVFEMLRESSDESSIDIIQRPVKKNKKKFQPPKQSKKEFDHYESKQEKPFSDSMFEVFTNPDKTRVESDDELDEDHEHNTNHDTTDVPEEEYNRSMFNEEDDTPSQGFQNIEDEKQDLLYKFYRLQSKGIPSSRKFNINSDVKEMRNEYDRIKRDMEINSSLRFSRRMLMACITGIEFLNKRYDPFDVQLEGWSESVIENVSDYDNVFERLHDKYASKVAMAPEIELLLSLAGSAFMFHLTNSMFSNAMPNLRDMAQQNPDIIKNMMQSMATHTQNNDEPSKTTPNNTDNVREMKPPIINMQSLMSNTPFTAIGNNSFPLTTRDNSPIVPTTRDNITSHNITQSNTFSSPPSLDLESSCSESIINDVTRTISLNSESQISKGGTRRKRGKKISMNELNSVTI
jgi:hypothetical protein